MKIIRSQYRVHENWTFKLKSANGSTIPGTILLDKKYPATVPGTIHTDLLANKLIAEPFYADNEIGLQWISDCDWEYESIIKIPKKLKKAKRLSLVFDGLDTIADIFLNDQLIGSPRNMFRKYSYSINPYLKEKNNSLRIVFASPVSYAKNEEILYGKLPVALRSERVYIRKSQYSFGWDWGPEFITSGIWKQVRLEDNDSLFIRTVHSETTKFDAENADIRVRISLSGLLGENNSANILLSYEGTTVYSEKHSISNNSEVETIINIDNPHLWNPSGMGAPHLYDLEVTLFRGEQLVDTSFIKIGIRTIELRLVDDDKKVFRFIVNGKPLFIKGANWIPAHSFLPEVTNTSYQKLVTLAKEGNMNMLRVWGGGIYESEVFYNLCDELGILVWQDFMFACAAYPSHEEFLENVKEEVRQNVERLSTHASIAIWCGNNENEWNWYKEQNQSFNEMPGHKIFSDLIPDILRGIDPLRPYRVSTPFGDDEDPNSTTSGNRHQWDIWSMWTDYDKVVDDKSLFVSEFGFQGPANIATLENCIPKNERHVQSRLFEFHNKQVDGNERIIRFLASHLPINTNWDDYIYLAQLNQGLALKTCLEHWRFSSGETNGAIIWQLNDCWPVTSWSMIDSDHTPKLAYHFVKNVFAPVALSFRKKGECNVLMALNDNDTAVSTRLEVVSIHSESGQIIVIANEQISLPAGSCNPVNELNLKLSNDKSVIHVATLYNMQGEIVHRTYLTLLPWKHLNLKSARVKKSLKKKNDEWFVLIKAKNPACFVDIIGKGLNFSPRGMIILPGEKIYVRVHSLSQREPDIRDISVYTLNDYLAGE